MNETSDEASHRRDAGHFVRWANRDKLTSLEFPATKWHGPARTSLDRHATYIVAAYVAGAAR